MDDWIDKSSLYTTLVPIVLSALDGAAEYQSLNPPPSQGHPSGRSYAQSNSIDYQQWGKFVAEHVVVGLIGGALGIPKWANTIFSIGSNVELDYTQTPIVDSLTAPSMYFHTLTE